MKRFLTAIVLTLAAATAAATTNFNDWSKLGGNPYTGTPAQAFAQAIERGISALQIEMARKQPAHVVLKKGQTCPGGWMFSGPVNTKGRAEVMLNPKFAWTDHETANATEYRLNPNAVLWHVDKCNNWVYCPGVPAPQAPPIAATPPPVVRADPPATPTGVQQTPPPNVLTFVIDIWSISRSLPEGQELLKQLMSDPTPAKEYKRQSRDLGDVVLEAAAETPPKVKRLPGCYPFHFVIHDMKLEKFIGSTIWVNNKPWPVPANYDPAKGVPVDVCDTTEGGWIAIPENPEWRADNLAWTVLSPFKPPTISYPRSGSLKECGPATQKTCRGPVYASGNQTAMSVRLAKLRPELEPRHYHFVVR